MEMDRGATEGQKTTLGSLHTRDVSTNEAQMSIPWKNAKIARRMERRHREKSKRGGVFRTDHRLIGRERVAWQDLHVGGKLSLMLFSLYYVAPSKSLLIHRKEAAAMQRYRIQLQASRHVARARNKRRTLAGPSFSLHF